MSATATIVVACGPPPLPPPPQLESGCHVWTDNGSGQGVYAVVSDGASRIVGSSEVAGPTMDATGEIAQNGTGFARYGNGELRINERPWGARIVGGDHVVVLERDDRGQSVTLHKSAMCAQQDAALGVAAMFLVLTQRRR